MKNEFLLLSLLLLSLLCDCYQKFTGIRKTCIKMRERERERAWTNTNRKVQWGEKFEEIQSSVPKIVGVLQAMHRPKLNKVPKSRRLSIDISYARRKKKTSHKRKPFR